MGGEDLSQLVKRLATRAGFDRCGIAHAGPIGRSEVLRRWLDAGHAATMEYLHRHFSKRVDPRGLLDGAKSVIVTALLYRNDDPEPRAEASCVPRGRTARYAWGDDYHTVVRAKLQAMVAWMREELSEPFEAKVCVDTVPLLERELAAAAGIGWIGKNTIVMDSTLGSYFVLGELVTTLDCPADEPAPDRCGACTACLDACPTRALVEPYAMDASRCISYLTIEHRGAIPEALARRMGTWIFGCDLCQEVCPHNRRAPATREPRFAARPPAPAPPLEEVLGWSAQAYADNLRGSAMKRAKLDMWKRNARIARDNLAGGARRSTGLV